MSLIQSPRHTRADLARWAELERGDAVRGRLARLARLEDRAIKALRAFSATGRFYAGVSWGKDSTAMVHLVQRSGVRCPVVFFHAGPVENPDCFVQRDAFLSRFDIDYSEHECSELAWSRDGTDIVHDGAQRAFARASRAHGGRYASGIRADESRARRMRMKHWGENSINTCAPIGHWTIVDVYAYLAKHDLPIHPAYACSMGGVYAREHIRVSTIGGVNGGERGRREWERAYYPETVRTVEHMAATWAALAG